MRLNQEVSVVICAYTEDRWDALVAAIESVKRQTVPAQEIIIVVDHNSLLLERIRTNISGIRVIENTEQSGLSGARNSGVAAAQSSIVAFIDDDAVAAPNWLEYLLPGYHDSTVIGVGGTIEPLWSGKFPKWFPKEFYWALGCTYEGLSLTSAPVRNLIGCNMSFRKELFHTIGGFKSSIGRVGTQPVGCEETEFCIRARQFYRQSEILYEPRARVFHHVIADRTKWAYFRSRCYSEGLSKALVTQSVGSKHGLSSERSHILRTLPKGIWTGIIETMTHLDIYGLIRSAMIIIGLIITIAGYGVGVLGQKLSSLLHIYHFYICGTNITK